MNTQPHEIELLTKLTTCWVKKKIFFFILFQFDLATVTQFAAHQDNRRLIGFVVHLRETLGEESMSAYVFESNTEGEKVCITFNKIFRKELLGFLAYTSGKWCYRSKSSSIPCKETCPKSQACDGSCLRTKFIDNATACTTRRKGCGH